MSSPQRENGGAAAQLQGHANGRWSTASELTHLQRRVADLAAELEVCSPLKAHRCLEYVYHSGRIMTCIANLPYRMHMQHSGSVCQVQLRC